MRRLWTEPTVSYEGEYEHVTGAGLAPLPVQRPIPIWFGAASPPAYRRARPLGAGWFPPVPPRPRPGEAPALVRHAARPAGPGPPAPGEGRRGGGGPGC